jgi:WD40 repeat protein
MRCDVGQFRSNDRVYIASHSIFFNMKFRRLEGHSQDVKFIRWHPSSSILISASYDDTIKVWAEDNDDFFCAQTITGHLSTVWGLSFHTDGQKFVSCSDDKSIIVFENDGDQGKGLWRSSASIKDLHKCPIYSIDWSHTTGYIATGGGDNSIVICRQGIAEDDLLHIEATFPEAHANDVNCVRWNPREEYSQILVSTGDDGLIKLWKFVL